MNGELLLSKEEISKFFLSVSKNSDDSSGVHCHISTLDNDSDLGSNGLNLESESLQDECITPDFEPVSPANKTQKSQNKHSDLVIYEQFGLPKDINSEKTSQLTDLIEKLAELSKKYEKVEKIEDQSMPSNLIDPELAVRSSLESREKGPGQPESEKKVNFCVEETKSQLKSEKKPKIENFLTQLKEDKKDSKKHFSGKSSQVACAKCSII